MKVFVTGASGFIGSAITRNLLAHQHTVIGLARSDASAQKLSEAGASSVRGTLADLDVLTQAARDADAVIHCAFIHDFASPDHNPAKNAQVDQDALKALVEGLRGTRKPIVASIGLLGGKPGQPLKETDTKAYTPREGAEIYFQEAAKEGLRTVMIRLAPTVHGPNDWGFCRILIDGAKRNGFAVHVDDQANWPAVHVEDAAELYRLAIEKDLAPGTILHGVAEEAVPTKEIAETMAKGTGVPVKKVTKGEAEKLYGFIGTCFASDLQASNVLTREKTGWKPSHQGLLADLEANYL